MFSSRVFRYNVEYSWDPYKQRIKQFFGRSSSTGRLSDMLLKVVFGSQLERGSCEALNMERPMDTTGRSFTTRHLTYTPAHTLTIT